MGYRPLTVRNHWVPLITLNKVHHLFPWNNYTVYSERSLTSHLLKGSNKQPKAVLLSHLNSRPIPHKQQVPAVWAGCSTEVLSCLYLSPSFWRPFSPSRPSLSAASSYPPFLECNEVVPTPMVPSYVFQTLQFSLRQLSFCWIDHVLIYSFNTFSGTSAMDWDRSKPWGYSVKKPSQTLLLREIFIQRVWGGVSNNKK